MQGKCKINTNLYNKSMEKATIKTAISWKRKDFRYFGQYLNWKSGGNEEMLRSFWRVFWRSRSTVHKRLKSANIKGLIIHINAKASVQQGQDDGILSRRKIFRPIEIFSNSGVPSYRPQSHIQDGWACRALFWRWSFAAIARWLGTASWYRFSPPWSLWSPGYWKTPCSQTYPQKNNRHLLPPWIYRGFPSTGFCQ